MTVTDWFVVEQVVKFASLNMLRFRLSSSPGHQFHMSLDHSGPLLSTPTDNWYFHAQDMLRSADSCDAVGGAMSSFVLFQPSKEGGIGSDLQKLHAALPLDPALEAMR